METHAFYLTRSEQTFKLENEINNLKGDKKIKVRKVSFYPGYFNLTKSTEIQWQTQIEGDPAERAADGVKPAISAESPTQIEGDPAERAADGVKPAAIINLNRDIIEAIGLIVPMSELEMDTLVLFYDVIRNYIRAYEAGTFEEFSVSVGQKINDLQNQIQTLNTKRLRLDFVADLSLSEKDDILVYLMLLTQGQIDTYKEARRIALEFIQEGFLGGDNEERTRTIRAAHTEPRPTLLVTASGSNAPVMHRLHKRETPADFSQGGEHGNIIIPSGFYNVDWFDFILNSIPGVSFKVHEKSNLVTIMITDLNLKLKLGKEVGKLLNLPRGRLVPNVIYKGKINTNPFKELWIHCPEINNNFNYFNGRPSYVLCTASDPSESAKLLKNDQITSFEFSLRNEWQEVINNKDGKILLEVDIF